MNKKILLNENYFSFVLYNIVSRGINSTCPDRKCGIFKKSCKTLFYNWKNCFDIQLVYCGQEEQKVLSGQLYKVEPLVILWKITGLPRLKSKNKESVEVKNSKKTVKKVEVLKDEN